MLRAIFNAVRFWKWVFKFKIKHTFGNFFGQSERGKYPCYFKKQSISTAGVVLTAIK